MSYSSQLAARIRGANPESSYISAALRAKAFQGTAETGLESTQRTIDRDATKILAMPQAQVNELSGDTYTSSTSEGGGQQIDTTQVEMQNLFD